MIYSCNIPFLSPQKRREKQDIPHEYHSDGLPRRERGVACDGHVDQRVGDKQRQRMLADESQRAAIAERGA